MRTKEEILQNQKHGFNSGQKEAALNAMQQYADEFVLKILEELKQESPFPNYIPHQYINNKITELKNSINGK